MTYTIYATVKIQYQDVTTIRGVPTFQLADRTADDVLATAVAVVLAAVPNDVRGRVSANVSATDEHGVYSTITITGDALGRAEAHRVAAELRR